SLEGKEGRRSLRAALQGWPDLERILTRLSSGSAGPRDYAALGQGLRRLPKVKILLEQLRLSAEALLRTSSPAAAGRGSMDSPPAPAGNDGLFSNFPEEPALAELLEHAIVEAPPATLKEGGVV